MSALSRLLHDGSVLAGAAGTIYAVTVAVAAMASILAPTADRRRDARETLKLLLHRRRTSR
jgi:hypothetical protein